MPEKQPYRPDGHCLVAQVSNLLYRRLPVGWACDLGSASTLSSASAMRAASGLEIRDTADWKSALRRGRIRPPDPCKVQAAAPPKLPAPPRDITNESHGPVRRGATPQVLPPIFFCICTSKNIYKSAHSKNTLKGI